MEVEGFLERERDVVIRQRVSRSAALIVLFAVGLAGLLSTVGCGGGGSSPATSQGVPGGTGPVAACVNGSVAGYVGSSCSQESAVVYKFTSYSCTSTPPDICTSLGPHGENLAMDMDTSTPQSGNTILVGKTFLWDVTAGQMVDVVITGSVYGAASNQSWPHWHNTGVVGQTGDGTEENITTVGCGSNCLDSNNGVSDILCSATSPIANCTDQSSIIPYGPYYAHFNPATAANPYPLTIEIRLNGGSNGTANLYSVGTHLTKP
jgi:hypothetical protein